MIDAILLAAALTIDCPTRWQLSGNTVSCAAAPVLTPPSGCTISGPTTAIVGERITLTSQCSGGGAPTAWVWWGGYCGGQTTQNCSPVETITGTVDYAVLPRNAAGEADNGVASHHFVTWNSPAVTCASQGIAVLNGGVLSWTQDATYHSQNNGNFGDATAWMFTLTVPAQVSPTNYPAGIGALTVAEYGGTGYARYLTISTQPCDFRLPIDPNGVNGPVAAGGGTTANVVFGTPGTGNPVQAPYMVLKPGTTYYVTISNDLATSPPSWSCGKPNCQAVLTYMNPRSATAMKGKATKARQAIQKKKSSP